MADDPHLQGLLAVNPFNIGEKVSNLSGTLSEAHYTVVQEGTCVAIR